MNNLGLGVRATNKINNFTGIITAKSEYLSGTIQYLVIPEELDKDGNQRKGIWADEFKLESDGRVIFPPIKLNETPIELGNKVKHFNGFIGIAEEKFEYSTGCVYFNVMPNVEDVIKMPKLEFIASQYLEVIPEENKVEVKDERTGGPSSNAPEM